MFTVKVIRKTNELSEQTCIYEVDIVQVQDGPFESEEGSMGFPSGVTKVIGTKGTEDWAVYINSSTPPADRSVGDVLAVIVENSNGKTTEIIR